MPTPETKALLAAAVAAAEDKKAEDLRILELDPADSGLTDYFLMMTGSNARQIQTLSDEIEMKLKRDFGEMPHSREGYKQAEWVLLDYVDFVVHIFSREKREFYALERLRKTASGVSPEEIRAALAERTTKSRGSKAVPAARKSRRKAVDSPVREALAANGARRGTTRKPASKAASSVAPKAAGGGSAKSAKAKTGNAVKVAGKKEAASRQKVAGKTASPAKGKIGKAAGTD